jgi:hypothetical protein
MTQMQLNIGRPVSKDVGGSKKLDLEIMTFISYRMWIGDVKHSGRSSERITSEETWRHDAEHLGPEPRAVKVARGVLMNRGR